MCVEQILTDFSLRQHRITESWEHWTTIIREKREIEQILQEIMSKNELVSVLKIVYCGKNIDSQSIKHEKLIYNSK